MDVNSRNLWILSAGVFLGGISASLVIPFLPRYLAELGVTENLNTYAGLTYASTFLSMIIMNPVWGNLSDRFGRKPMIIRSGIGMAVIYVLLALVTAPYQVPLLRFLQGFVAGFIPSANALLATTLPDHMVGRGLARMSSSLAAGMILGPLVGGTLADLFSIRTTMAIASVGWVVAALLVAFMVKENPGGLGATRTSVLQDLRTAFSHPRTAAVLIAAPLAMAGIQSIEPILTIFAPTLRQEPFLGDMVRLLFGRGEARTFISGFIVSLPGLAMVLFAGRWSGLGQRVGFPKVITFALLGASLLSLPHSLVTTAGMLMLFRFAYGTMTAAVQPSLGVMLASSVHPTFRGRAFAINASMGQIGMMIGPVVGGLVADWTSQRAVFVLASVLLLATATWVWTNLVSRPADGTLAGAPLSERVSTGTYTARKA